MPIEEQRRASRLAPAWRSEPDALIGGENARSLAGARAALRAQIAALEKKLSAVACQLDEPLPAPGGSPRARLLDIGELELIRDDLVARLQLAHARSQEQRRQHSEARRELEEMIEAPERFRFARISCAQLGLPGCGDYVVRPRLGLLGMLAGWWEVKLSSGCP